jgi:hypothetical protein
MFERPVGVSIPAFGAAAFSTAAASDPVRYPSEISFFVNSSAILLSSAATVDGTSLSTGANDAHAFGAAAAARGRSPMSGFPSKAGSGGSPRSRASVGARSKTLAFPRFVEGTTSGPAATRIPGGRCQRNAVSTRAPSRIAGRSLPHRKPWSERRISVAPSRSARRAISPRRRSASAYSASTPPP